MSGTLCEEFPGFEDGIERIRKIGGIWIDVNELGCMDNGN